MVNLSFFFLRGAKPNLLILNGLQVVIWQPQAPKSANRRENSRVVGVAAVYVVHYSQKNYTRGSAFGRRNPAGRPISQPVDGVPLTARRSIAHGSQGLWRRQFTLRK